MTEGRFEKGRWVEDQTNGISRSDDGPGLEERLAVARVSFEKGLNDILTIGQELLTTDQGRRHIGKTMDKACNEIRETMEDTAKKATDFINDLLDQKQK